MSVRGVLSLLFLLLLSPSLGEEDTVAKDIGVHQLGRMVELLTLLECEELLYALSHPEENIFQQLERLSLENNQLDLKPRVKRDTDSEMLQCRTALTDWLLKHGEQTYYDRLSRALQHIGRTDIAVEVGKNINQDKTLSMQRYVEGYNQHINTIQSPQVKPETEDHHHIDQQPQARQARDFTWSDLELIVERAPVAPYRRRLMEGAWPLVYGVLLGFGGAFLLGLPLLLFLLHISRHDHQKLLRLTPKTRKSSSHGRLRRSNDNHVAGDMASVEMVGLKPKRSHGKVRGSNPGAPVVLQL